MTLTRAILRQFVRALRALEGFTGKVTIEVRVTDGVANPKVWLAVEEVIQPPARSTPPVAGPPTAPTKRSTC